MLIAIKIVFGARFFDVNQMIGHSVTIDEVVFKVFACAEVHASIDLTRVGTDDFGA